MFWLIEFAKLIVAIVAIMAIAGVLTAYFKSKGTNVRRQEERQQERDDELAERFAKLEDRIRVLERIVTDEQYEVRQRFKGL